MSVPAAMRGLARTAVERLDLAFTLGRILGLAPVLVMSHRIGVGDPDLSGATERYQVALFLSTLVLYGAPQTYLVKLGIERKVAVHHLAISAGALATVILVLDLFDLAEGLLAPFVFVVIFRSYYLLFATIWRDDPRSSLLLLMSAILSLIVYAVTLNYWAAGAVSLLSLVIASGRGDISLRYLRVAVRRYAWILTRNASYFVAFLLQQTFGQVLLFAYAFLVSGDPYVVATQIVYLYTLAFVGHGMVFRYYLSRLRRERREVDPRRVVLRNMLLSILLGTVSAGCLVVLRVPMGEVLFGSSAITRSDALLVGALVIINSINFGWNALFLSIRRPQILIAVSMVSTAVTLALLVVLERSEFGSAVILSMSVGLTLQAILRAVVGVRLLRQSPKVLPSVTLPG